jgi:EAL domain-containing protein (putative c-di-GMP-specific phosphodiesterase class I)/GGDEF domain-containing protein
MGAVAVLTGLLAGLASAGIQLELGRTQEERRLSDQVDLALVLGKERIGAAFERGETGNDIVKDGQQALSAQRNFPGIADMRLYDPQGQLAVVIVRDPTPRDRLLTDESFEQLGFWLFPSAETRSIPVSWSRRPENPNESPVLGRLEITPDRTGTASRYVGAMAFMAILELLRIILVAAGVGLVAYWFVERPLLRLARQLRLILDPKRVSARAIPTPSGHEFSELGALIAILNSGIAALAQARRSQVNAARELEIVKERMVSGIESSRSALIDLILEETGERFWHTPNLDRVLGGLPGHGLALLDAWRRTLQADDAARLSAGGVDVPTPGRGAGERDRHHRDILGTRIGAPDEAVPDDRAPDDLAPDDVTPDDLANEFKFVFRMTLSQACPERADQVHWVSVHGRMRSIDGRTARIVGAVTDITAEIEARELALTLSTTDPITGLPNLSAALARVQKAREASPEQGSGLMAIAHVSLARVTATSEAFGQGAADHLMRSVAQRLGAINDTYIERLLDAGQVLQQPYISRGGYKSFYILFEGWNAWDVDDVCNRILEKLTEPVAIGETFVAAAPSVGVTFFDRATRSRRRTDRHAPASAPHIQAPHIQAPNIQAAELLREADVAQRHGRLRGIVVNYQASLENAVRARLEFEGAITRAIEQDEVLTLYRPRMDSTRRKLVAVEAHLRWFDSTGRVVRGFELAPVAEQAGLMLRLGRRAAEQALQAFGRWVQGRYGFLRLGIATSVRELTAPDLIPWVIRACEDAEVLPNDVDLNVPERALVEIGDAIEPILRQLRQIGFGIVVDDFESGFGGLLRLHRLPLSGIKLNRHYVAGVPEESHACSVSGAVIDHGNRLGLRVIAEGVETEAQWRYLRNVGAAEFQGPGIGRSVDEDSFFHQWLRLASFGGGDGASGGTAPAPWAQFIEDDLEILDLFSSRARGSAMPGGKTEPSVQDSLAALARLNGQE